MRGREGAKAMLVRALTWSVAVMLLAVVSAVAVGGSAQRGNAATAVAALDSELTSPALTSAHSGRTDVFQRAGDGRLSWLSRPAGGSWTRPVDLGGGLTSQPAATSGGTDRVDVVARGRDGAAWWRSLRGGRWSAWTSLGGRIVGGASVAASGDRLDVVAAGTDGALWHRFRPPGGVWSPWRRVGGTATSAPALVARAPGRLDVVVRDGAGRLAHAWWSAASGRWSAWDDLGGVLTSQPALASPGAGELDVVVRGADNAFWLKRYASGSGWSGWQSLGGRFASGPGAGDDGAAVSVAARAANGVLVEGRRASPGAAWTRWTAVDALLPFRRLGTWVDVFDYGTMTPATAVADMRARGVRVLYLGTARFTDSGDFHDPVEAGRWLDAAHAAGLKVVGWYLPAYGDMARDVRRTVAIASFRSPGGQRFDAVGVDIERLDEVTLAEFRVRLVSHLQQVRARTPMVVGAIVPSPFTTEPGNRWEGFPWQSVGAHSEVVVPMALWSFRDACPGDTVCPYSAAQVYDWVRDQTERARVLSGRPVSVEGGVDDPGTERTPVTADRVDAFVDAVLDGRAVGGSHYDYRTTPATLWPSLSRLNGL